MQADEDIIDTVAIIEEHSSDGLQKEVFKKTVCAVYLKFCGENTNSLCSCVVCDTCHYEDCDASDHSDDSSASVGVHRVFSSEYLIPTYTNEPDYNDIRILFSQTTAHNASMHALF